MHTISSNGANIPALGLGTWDLRGAVARNMVHAMLERGCRHVDTAVAYRNEAEVGEGLRTSGVARNEVFLTTKIWPTDFKPAAFSRAATQSLQRLGTDYVDLLLLHWPNPSVPLADTLGALAKAKCDGLARHVGVSNFPCAMLDEAVALCDEPIAVNQVEYHPYVNQDLLLACLRRHGIALAAYCPIARGKVFEDPVVRQIGARHAKSAAQVALRWLVQQPGVAALPRSSSVEHASANFDIFDFELDADEMRAFAALAVADGRVVPGNGEFTPDWD